MLRWRVIVIAAARLSSTCCNMVDGRDLAAIGLPVDLLRSYIVTVATYM